MIWFACATVVLAVDAERWYLRQLFGFYGRHAAWFDGHPVRQLGFLLALPVKLYAMVVLWGIIRRATLRYDPDRLEGSRRVRGKSSTHLHRSKRKLAHVSGAA